MSDQATLSFLSWMRRGLARSLSTPSVDGAPTAPAASIEASVIVGDGSGVGDSTPIVQSVALRGPGDVVGLARSQIVRSDPAPGVQDFEPNYFCCVELASAELPWMFTPATASGQKLVPWLALVVVRKTAGVAIVTRSGAPLRVLTITTPADAASELPDLGEAWAWAHVQSTADLSTVDVADAYAAAPEHFLARLVCPRRLDPNTRYIAAVVPTFEAGRRAGLGLAAQTEVETTDPGWWQAWDPNKHEVELPIYYSWTFKTGSGGDFESLVRRLTPRELQAGTKDFDIGDQGTTALPPNPPAPRLVSWKGALVSPAATVREPNMGHLNRLRRMMRGIVQDGLDGGSEPAASETYDPRTHDPVIGPPAYGALPAGEDRIPAPHIDGEPLRPRERPLWLGEANLDPVHRSAAGLGSEVVRRNQETLMASAWLQAAALRKINRTLNWTRTAAEVGARQKARRLEQLSDAALVQLSAPAKSRLRLAPGETAEGRFDSTSLPTGMVSSAFRRIARPEGPLGRAARATNTTATPIVTAPNRATSMTKRCIVNLDRALAHTVFIRPTGLHIGSETLMVGIPGGEGVTEPAADTSRWTRARGSVSGVQIAAMPTRFQASPAWAPSRETIISATPTTSGQDQLRAAAHEIKATLDPKATLCAKLARRITAPGDPFAGGALPAALHASPSFVEPLYEALRDIDPEFLLPGVGEIPNDTVGLTYVNAAFVEAFLLGANHELGREFAWREYPAALDETWLRVFWDSLPGPGEAIDTVTYDVPPIAEWSKPPYRPISALGEHQTGPGAAGTLVLIIKGELLRKYPDTIIYASKAVWNPARTGDDGTSIPANTMREELVDGDGQPVERRDPVFVGTLDGQTVFMGFALEVGEALGPVDEDGLPIPGGQDGDRDGGWFFVFEEAPAGPRFGLDVGTSDDAGAPVASSPAFWRDASWYHQVESAERLTELSHAQASGRLAPGSARWYDDPASAGGGKFSARWGKNAASMARITLQRPVRMLVHASAMLPDEGGE